MDKTVTFLHTADLHLGYRQYGIPRREEDFLTALDNVVDRAISLHVAGIILAGDVFDSAKPSAYVVRRVQLAVQKAQTAGIAVVGIDGNHDVANADWIKICGITPVNETQGVIVLGVRITGLSYARPTVFKEKLKAMADAGITADIFVLHQAVAELADFSAQELTLMEMSPFFEKMGVKYVAMGDIHDYKELELAGIRYAYSGSPEVTAIDERRDKSCSIIEIGPTGLKTRMELLAPRTIVEKHLRTAEDLNDLLKEAERDPLLVLWYEPDKRDLAKRAEDLLAGSTIMHRICPVVAKGTLTAQMTRTVLERQDALQHLKNVIRSCFVEGSDQHQLVIQLLDTPDSVESIVQGYMKSKGFAP